MKTAVQIAVEKLEQFIPAGNQLAIRLILDEALEKEKEQIKDAYNDGYFGDAYKYKDWEDYFNQTYNQNKSFTYCQSEIEGQSICDKQCDHCKEYYAPLENQNK